MNNDLITRARAQAAFVAKDTRDLLLELVAALEASSHREHFCVRCHHRWTGELFAEYCGDCHRESLALRREEPQEAHDEEMTPHAFNSRTRYEPGDDRDIWCADCEYHRDHEIHAERARVTPGEPPPGTPSQPQLVDRLTLIETMIDTWKTTTLDDVLCAVRNLRNDVSQALPSPPASAPQNRRRKRRSNMAALPTMGGDRGDFTAQPTSEQKQRYALRQCYLLAIRMARREQKHDDSRSSEWSHILRFCKDADENGNIVGSSSLLRQSASAPAAKEPECVDAHTWSNQFGDDWTPEVGMPCDCGLRQWGVPKEPEEYGIWVTKEGLEAAKKRAADKIETIRRGNTGKA